MEAGSKVPQKGTDDSQHNQISIINSIMPQNKDWLIFNYINYVVTKPDLVT